MANKAKRKAQEHWEAQRQASIARALQENKTRSVRAQKRQSPEKLFSSLQLYDHQHKEIRSLDRYVSRSYNLERQQRDLLRHLYVRYQVPDFMYEAFRLLTAAGSNRETEETKLYKKWFFCIAQGGSFRKMVKGLLSRAEADLFLKAPDDITSGRIFNAVWYARLKNRGVNDGMIKRLLYETRLFALPAITPEAIARKDHVINFFARYQNEMDKDTFGQISDYIEAQVGNALWTLQGRTLASVIALSNEWHNFMATAKYGAKVSWAPRWPKIWEKEEKTVIWEVVELSNNYAIINEGRKQHNCVSIYVQRCLSGDTQILSLRKHDSWSLKEEEKIRVTIEVQKTSIVQAKGKLNKSPGNEEMRILRLFARDRGLTITTNRWGF